MRVKNVCFDYKIRHFTPIFRFILERNVKNLYFKDFVPQKCGVLPQIPYLCTNNQIILCMKKVYTVYIPVKPFVAQWLKFHFGDPVKFPDFSLENQDLRRFSLSKHEYQKLKIKETEHNGGVLVVLPQSKSKDPATYHYLGKRGEEAVVDSIERLFRRNMFCELGDETMRGCNLNIAIRAFCEKHGIEEQYSNTIKQRYYRIRDSYQKCGIDLRKKTKTQ